MILGWLLVFGANSCAFGVEKGHGRRQTAAEASPHFRDSLPTDSFRPAGPCPAHSRPLKKIPRRDLIYYERMLIIQGDRINLLAQHREEIGSMPRPCCCRRIDAQPRCVFFKPAGVPATDLDEVLMGVDELEAIRLADVEGLCQADGAERMNVSRPTFGRILEAAHRKAADALIAGKALRIEGGVIEMNATRQFQCSRCGHCWQSPHGSGRPGSCPQCQSPDFHRQADDRGGRRARCGHGGHGHRGGRGPAGPCQGQTRHGRHRGLTVLAGPRDHDPQDTNPATRPQEGDDA